MVEESECLAHISSGLRSISGRVEIFFYRKIKKVKLRILVFSFGAFLSAGALDFLAIDHFKSKLVSKKINTGTGFLKDQDVLLEVDTSYPK